MEKLKRNILVISNMYPSTRSKTYGIFVKNQVEQIRAKGYKVDVLAISDPRRGKYYSTKKHLLWFLRALFVLVFKGRKYDVVHAHYIFPSGWLALLFKKLYKTKVILTSHGGDIDQMAQKGDFVFNQTKKVLEESDHVIAVGEHLKSNIVGKFGIDPAKVTVMNMGVNREIFSVVEKKVAKKSLNLMKEHYHLLYVGNIIEQKGVLDLLEAFSLLRERYKSIQLHLIGSWADPTFRETVNKKKLVESFDDVFIHNPMKQEEIAKWMAAADVFVLPSHIEGFGLVALEAMSVHTPVVGTRVGGLKYLLRNNAGFLVNKKDFESLAEGIDRVLKDTQLRNLLIENGENMASKYSHNAIIEDLIEIYNKT